MEEHALTAIRKTCEKLSGENREEWLKALEEFLCRENPWPEKMSNDKFPVEIGTHSLEELRSAIRGRVSDQATRIIQLAPVVKRKKKEHVSFLSVRELGIATGEDFHLGIRSHELCEAIEQVGRMPTTETVLQAFRQGKIPRSRVVIPTKENDGDESLCFFAIKEHNGGPWLGVANIKPSEIWAPEMLVGFAVKEEHSENQSPEKRPDNEQDWFPATSLIH